MISLPSKGLSRVFSNTTAQKHQFFDAQLSLWSNSRIHTCYGYGNVIHCLSGKYDNTILLSGQLYILLALIITVCLLAQFSMYLSQILFKLSDWTIKIILICTNLLIVSLFSFFPPQRFLSSTLLLSVISDLQLSKVAAQLSSWESLHH